MIEDNFYVILPSNVRSIASKNENKANKYTTHLAKALELDKEEFMVGLAEISYVHSWSSSIIAKSCEYKIAIADLAKREQRPTIEHACLPQGQSVVHYHSIEDLIVGLNERRPQKFRGKFRMGQGGHVEIQLALGEMIMLDNYLADLIGFSRTKMVFSYGKLESDSQLYTIEAENKPDISIAMYNMYVYCDIVDNTQVGDTLVPLLRTVPIDKQNKDKYVVKSFNPIRYLPLSTAYIPSIHMVLANDTGELVPFQYGKTVVTLHFKKKQ